MEISEIIGKIGLTGGSGMIDRIFKVTSDFILRAFFERNIDQEKFINLFRKLLQNLPTLSIDSITRSLFIYLGEEGILSDLEKSFYNNNFNWKETKLCCCSRLS